MKKLFVLLAILAMLAGCDKKDANESPYARGYWDGYKCGALTLFRYSYSGDLDKMKEIEALAQQWRIRWDDKYKTYTIGVPK
jgi:hypothetical protein